MKWVLNAPTVQASRARAAVAAGLTETLATAAFLGSVAEFPHLRNQAPDLYRAFIEQCWQHASDRGLTSLIHPRSHFTEAKAAPLRREAYLRLRRNWNITNKLGLFDINRDEKNFDVAIYGSRRAEPDFIMASSVHHPRVINESLIHDGSGTLPAFRDDNDNWDLRPHRERILHVDLERLSAWKSILEDENTSVLDTRMVYTVNSNAMQILTQLATAPRMKDLQLQFSRGWDESIDKKNGHFDSFWSRPTAWDEVILQGPHLGVSTPMAKEPNPTLKNNQDWSLVDLENISEDFIPATAYKISEKTKLHIDDSYGRFHIKGEDVPSRSICRIAWRRMAANTGFRTLYPAIIPPGALHVHPVVSGASTLGNKETVIAGTIMSSLVSDFFLRSMSVSDIHGSVVEKLPIPKDNSLLDEAVFLYLRLNCLTRAWALLWEELQKSRWTSAVPIRTSNSRRRAQDRIDEIVANRLGLTQIDLANIYSTQFPVMRGYDRKADYRPAWILYKRVTC